MPTELSARGQPLREVTALFLKLGFTAFGGPAAHIGMFRQEFVQRRKWLTDEHFLDLLGATNLIPGPNSTEMAIHLGFLRAGWAGLIAGGAAFTLPAVLIVLVLAWLYVKYGSTPQAGWLLYGVKPVVIAIIVQALWELGRKAVKNALTLAVGVGSVALYFSGVNEVLLLFAGGLVVMLIQNRSRLRQLRRGDLPLLLPLLPGLAAGPVSFSLPTLFLTFLKIGAILYGSGYVLVALLRADFVARLGWLTEQQLIDAIAIGQITPGPLFTSATFIGYLLGGVPAALIATLGIFLPSYVFVAISNPIIPKLRRSPWAGSLLDGVIAASLGLMAAVSFQLGLASLVDAPTLLIFALSAVLLFRFNVNSTWLVLGGGLAGLLRTFIG
ncbi:MAG TPA: chromate efflux transporter [Anaerolineales bacterium]|nr:chromate efflux transporter [Anaerolineales bacterium]